MSPQTSFQNVDRVFSLRPVVMVAAVVTVLFAGLANLEAAPYKAKVKKVKGNATYALPAKQVFQPLKPGTELPVGSTVKTGADGNVTILTLPGAAIQVQPNTKVTMSLLDFARESGNTGKITSRKAVLKLETGVVSALIKKNNPKTTDFRIQTPQGVAAARGTFYAVAVKDGKSTVAVKEGKVSVLNNEDLGEMAESESTSTESAQ